MNKFLGRTAAITAGTAALLVAGTALAQWSTYRAERFGFSMSVPNGTSWRDISWSDGWGGLEATVEGVRLYGAAKLGTQATREQIERFGVELTGISADHWTELTHGENSRGWTWFRVARAQHGGRVALAGYGVGPRGSYCLVLRTTASDFQAHRTAYERWYNSVSLF